MPEASPPPTASAVEARGLAKRFGDLVAVADLDLTIPRGTCFGLLGPNGAGKTTTIRMLQGHTKPSSGALHVLGFDVRREPRQAKARIGLVPQENNLDPDFTVERNLLVYARYFGIHQPEARRRAKRLLEFVQLSDKGTQRIDELSGGMKRRLVVARSLVNDPELLILDEPTTGLDPQARHAIWDRIRRLRHEGKTILLTTHYMDEAESLCDRLAIMDQGRIIESGAPAELIAKHTESRAVEFVVGWSEEGRATQEVAATLAARGVMHQRLPDRVIAYGGAAVESVTPVQQRHAVERTIERHATLEDVFLRLTGRALRE